MRRRGQGVTEFALVTPLFLTMIFGIIEMSWALYGYTTVQSAANEAARRGMVLNRPASNYGLSGNSSGTGQTLSGCNAATILGTVGCALATIPSSRITVDISVPDPNGYPNSGENVPPGKTISVKVHYRYIPILAYPLKFNTNFTITGYATTQTQ